MPASSANTAATTAALHQKLGLSIKRLQHRHHQALNTALADINISLVQWDALRHLKRNPDASQHQLAQLTFQTDQAFGTLAQRLIERGLIERLPGAGRALKHRLTPLGEALCQQGQAIVAKIVGATFSVLSPQQAQQLDQLLDLLLEAKE